jgi:hypothetical protein
MARRLLALFAAVGMVAVALAVRNQRDEGGAGHSTASGRLQLVCATELAAVCDGINAAGIDVTIEPATVTADRLHSADADDPGIDGWLAPGRWGAVVDSARSSSAGHLFARAGEPLARSPFVLAVWKDKRAALACATADLGCVGDAVTTRGFRLGVAADDQAEGVLTDAALGAGHAKNSNFATNDLDETDLSDWLAAVDANTDRVSRNPGGRSFTELLTFGAAAADGYLSTEADVGPQFVRAAKRSQLDLLYVAPVATADVLLSVVTGKRGDRLNDVVRSERIRKLLQANGWRVEGLSLVAGVNTTPRLPADDGLPSAGVLQAVRAITK